MKNKKLTLNEELSQMKKMMGKLINEDFEPTTQYERFKHNYISELRDAVKNLKQVTTDMIDNLDEDQRYELEKKMETYDDDVLYSIENMVFNNNVSIDQICHLAIGILNDYGTEPQFMIYAINDFTDFFDINVEKPKYKMPGFENLDDELDDVLRIR